MNYRDEDWRVLFVTDGISGGKSWFTGYRTDTGAIKRFTSPACPIRQTREEAQHDLDLIASRRGWIGVVADER